MICNSTKNLIWVTESWYENIYKNLFIFSLFYRILINLYFFKEIESYCAINFFTYLRYVCFFFFKFMSHLNLNIIVLLFSLILIINYFWKLKFNLNLTLFKLNLNMSIFTDSFKKNYNENSYFRFFIFYKGELNHIWFWNLFLIY